MDTWSTLCAADAADAHRETWPARADEYGPFRQWLEFAHTQSAADYAAAHATRLEYAGKIAGLFEEIDLLACPAMPFAAPRIGDDALPLPDANVVRPRFTYPFNFSNSPTLTLPCGFTSDDLPITTRRSPLLGRDPAARRPHVRAVDGVASRAYHRRKAEANYRCLDFRKADLYGFLPRRWPSRAAVSILIPRKIRSRRESQSTSRHLVCSTIPAYPLPEVLSTQKLTRPQSCITLEGR